MVGDFGSDKNNISGDKKKVKLISCVAQRRLLIPGPQFLRLCNESYNKKPRKIIVNVIIINECNNAYKVPGESPHEW